MTIVYKTNPLTYWIGPRLVKINHLGLCNIIAQQSVAEEFIQHEATSEAIAEEIIRLINDSNYRQQTLQKLAPIKGQLGGHGGSDRAANVALSMIV